MNTRVPGFTVQVDDTPGGANACIGARSWGARCTQRLLVLVNGFWGVGVWITNAHMPFRSFASWRLEVADAAGAAIPHASATAATDNAVRPRMPATNPSNLRPRLKNIIITPILQWRLP